MRDKKPLPIPNELRIAFECERYHALPDVGGYLDQDYGLVNRMTGLSSVYNAVSAWFNLTGVNIHRMSEQTRRILRMLLDAGIPFNG